MAKMGEVFIISVPKEQVENIAPLLPSDFKPSDKEKGQPEFRFGIGEFAEYVGVAKDMAEFLLAILGIVAALRAAGGGKVGIRSATRAEPITIDSDMDDETIRSKLKNKDA